MAQQLEVTALAEDLGLVSSIPCRLTTTVPQFQEVQCRLPASMGNGHICGVYTNVQAKH